MRRNIPWLQCALLFGTRKDPIYISAQFTWTHPQVALKITKYAIEAHNGAPNDYNQKLSPNEFDTALEEATYLNPLIERPLVLVGKNDGSAASQLIRDYRDEVTIYYAENNAGLLASLKSEMREAKLVRARLFAQNQELILQPKRQTSNLTNARTEVSSV